MDSTQIPLKRNTCSAPLKRSFFNANNIQIDVEEENANESSNYVNVENPLSISKNFPISANPFQNILLQNQNPFNYKNNKNTNIFQQSKITQYLSAVPSTNYSNNNLTQCKYGILSNLNNSIQINQNAQIMNNSSIKLQVNNENYKNRFIGNNNSFDALEEEKESNLPMDMKYTNNYSKNKRLLLNNNKTLLNPFKNPDEQKFLSEIMKFKSGQCPFCKISYKYLKKHILRNHSDKLEKKDLINYSLEIVSEIKRNGKELDEIIQIIFKKMDRAKIEQTHKKWYNDMQKFYKLTLNDL